MVKDKQAKIVCNTSPIINLSKINRLDLIKKLYGMVIIPGAVFDELIVQGGGKEDVSGIKLLIDEGIIDIQKPKNSELIRALRKDLDYGESEAIALALEIKADLVILDEKDARDIAGIYKLEKTGFLGILIRAKKEGLIESVKEYLDSVIETGFWIDETLYQHIIKELDEK